jgi:hypothetical protein
VATKPDHNTTPTALATLEPRACERCDRCGARAAISALLASGLHLALCGHHGRKHRAALLSTGAILWD